MAADDPYGRNLLVESRSPPPVPASTRRRVNPESLAVRLGPELVKELESYVKPGLVEMPSFAIRQQIQQRHKVDRRHIYDWFHSKGLRVTKEDKRATVEQKTDAMRMQRRIRRSIAPALPSAKAYPSLRVAAPHGCPSSPAVLTRPAISREFRPTGAPELLPHADTSLDYDGIITRRHNIPRTTVPATPTYTVPVKDHTPSASRVLQKMTSTSVHLSRPPPGYSRKFRDHQIDSVFLTEGTAALGQREREKCYDTLSRVLGPADGIQECVGTYKAYMARQLEIYYEDFLPGTPAPVSEVSYGTNSLLSPMGQSQATHVASQQGSVSSQAPQEDDGPHLWDALTAILDFPSCSSASQVLPGCASMTVDSTSVGAVGFESLGGTLANPAPPERERPRTVTFAAAKGMPPSSGFNPRPYLPFFDSSSSSLAGALGETALVQDAPRKAKEWVRPQMGRARAYSAGGGM